MSKEIGEIQKRIEILLKGNWTNDRMGELEEMCEDINQIGKLLTFIIADLIQKKVLDIDFIKEEYLDGWKIDS